MVKMSLDMPGSKPIPLSDIVMSQYSLPVVGVGSEVFLDSLSCADLYMRLFARAGEL